MITVASYNMRKAIGLDRRRDPARTLAVLNELDADVIALQEADRRFGERASAIPRVLMARDSDYIPVPTNHRPASIGWHGNALLVRKSVKILDCCALTIPALEPRGAVSADLSIGGEKVRVVGMHLDLSGLWRRRQANAILAWLQSRDDRMPTVLMGDLNEWSIASGCLRDFGHHLRFADCGKSFHARHPVAELDRIMVSDELAITEAGVHRSALARRASDHLPIWARLTTA